MTRFRLVLRVLKEVGAGSSVRTLVSFKSGEHSTATCDHKVSNKKLPLPGSALLRADRVDGFGHLAHDVKAIEDNPPLAVRQPSRVAPMYGSHMSIATASTAAFCSL
jgi:hypothetical protein